MIGNKTVLVTICARGNSKGIPGKNLKPLGGKPLIQWTLDLIAGIKYADDVVVSSDSDAILDIALPYPFLQVKRDPAFATDTISRVEAIKDAAIKAETTPFSHCKYDIIVDLGVATPFKTAEDVNETIELVDSFGGHATTGYKANHSPYFDMVDYYKDNLWKLCCRSFIKPQSRQEADFVFIVNTLNDAVNVWTRDSLFNNIEMMYIYEMPPARSVHLDTPLDWAFAEFLLEKGYIGGKTNG